MRKVKFIFFMLMVCCFYHSSLKAQLKLTHYVVGNGVATISGSGHVSSVTIGQPIIGNTINTIYSNNIGFWYQYEQTITDVEEDHNIETPIEFQLYQNYPNPFNPMSKIKYSIPKQCSVKLKIFDILGSEVETLVNKEQPQGNFEIDFDGSYLTSGIYFYRLQSGNYVETKKMILIK